MSETKIYPVSGDAKNHSHLNPKRYEELYQQSINAPEEFWAEQAGELLHWHEPCLLYTSPSPRDATLSRMPSSA